MGKARLATPDRREFSRSDILAWGLAAQHGAEQPVQVSESCNLESQAMHSCSCLCMQCMCRPTFCLQHQSSLHGAEYISSCGTTCVHLPGSSHLMPSNRTLQCSASSRGAYSILELVSCIEPHRTASVMQKTQYSKAAPGPACTAVSMRIVADAVFECRHTVPCRFNVHLPVSSRESTCCHSCIMLLCSASSDAFSFV